MAGVELNCKRRESDPLHPRTFSAPQDHVSGRVPAPDPPADQEAGGAAAEGLLQGRPHHPAPARPGGEDR